MEEYFDDFKDWVWTNERVAELRQFAEENRFVFKKREQFADQAYRLKGLPVFKGKKGKRIKGILRWHDAEEQMTTRIYDYVYFGELGKKQTTIFEFHQPKLQLTPFSISPKGTFAKMKAVFMKGERLFDEAGAFNSAYDLQTEDKEGVQYDLNPKFLNLIAEKESLRVEGEDDYLVFYYKSKKLASQLLLEEYDFMYKAYEGLRNGSSEDEFV